MEAEIAGDMAGLAASSAFAALFHDNYLDVAGAVFLLHLGHPMERPLTEESPVKAKKSLSFQKIASHNFRDAKKNSKLFARASITRVRRLSC